MFFVRALFPPSCERHIPYGMVRPSDFLKLIASSPDTTRMTLL